MSKFRYHCNRILAWAMDNKIIVLLGVLSFSLMISTWVLSNQKSRLKNEVKELREMMSTTTATTQPSTELTDTSSKETVINTEQTNDITTTPTTTDATIITTPTTISKNTTKANESPGNAILRDEP